jgi:hypothetical protein
MYTTSLHACPKHLLALTALLALVCALGAPAYAASSSRLGSQFPLYVTSPGNNAIVKVDSTGAQSVVTSGGYLSNPVALAVDGSGNLYVVSQNNFIVTVDSSGVQSLFTADGDLFGPFGLAFTRGYLFSSFFPPVDNPPTVNMAKAGRAVPVRFSLGGDQGLDILAAGSPTS